MNSASSYQMLNVHEDRCKINRPLCSWGHVIDFYIMGYNLKNVRNGKSASNTPKWPSLSPLELKSKFIRQFEFSVNVEDLNA